MRAIHQIVAGFANGDAISNEARTMRALFRSWGYESQIYSERRRILPELIQNEATPDNVSRAALRLMTDPVVRAQAAADLKEVRVNLGEPGAVKRVASIVLDVASGRKE